MAQSGSAVEVGFDGFFHQAAKGFLAVWGGFVEADDVFVVVLQRRRKFRPKGFHAQFHRRKIREDQFVVNEAKAVLGCLSTFAKERFADSNHGGAFLDGHFEIAAHSHAELRKRSAQNLFGLLLELFQTAKARTGAFRFPAPRRHSHKAVNFKPIKGVEDSQFFERFIGAKSMFASLAGNIDFKKHGDRFGQFFASAVESLGNPLAVDTVNHSRQSGGLAAFVSLQMPNKVPAQIARTLRRFLFEFLNFAFPKQGQAALEGFPNAFGIAPLADGEDRHFLRRSPRTPAGIHNPPAYLLQVCGNAHGFDFERKNVFSTSFPLKRA